LPLAPGVSRGSVSGLTVIAVVSVAFRRVSGNGLGGLLDCLGGGNITTIADVALIVLVGCSSVNVVVVAVGLVVRQENTDLIEQVCDRPLHLSWQGAAIRRTRENEKRHQGKSNDDLGSRPPPACGWYGRAVRGGFGYPSELPARRLVIGALRQRPKTPEKCRQVFEIAVTGRRATSQELF
jgi:hypothetical protein